VIRESTTLLTLVLILVALGTLMVYSATGFKATDEGDTLGVLYDQLLYVALGLALLIVFACMDYHWLAKRWFLWPVVLASLGLLVAVLFMADDVYGGQRWLKIGSFQFQPSECAKFALVILLAVKLVDRREDLHEFKRGFLPVILIVATYTGLILAERDLGTPMVIATVGALMILVAGARWQHLALASVPAVLGVVGLCVAFPFRMRRIVAFTDPWAEEFRRTEGYHLIQSLSGFARGSVWGQGPGASEQKLHYLFGARNDFIFAVLGEEMGLVGTLLLVGLFVAFIIVALRIAGCAPDMLGSLLAFGVAALVAVQTCVNMGVATGLLPTKGLPLPFISAGGTALVVNLALVGVLINVGLQSREPERADQLAAANS
jgi:cell division protein FtsW